VRKARRAGVAMQASPTQFGSITASFIMRALYKMRNLRVKLASIDAVIPTVFPKVTLTCAAASLSGKSCVSGKSYQIRTVGLNDTPGASRLDP
jgi:uncharacterized membrane protein YjjP (DUF1212 family)